MAPFPELLKVMRLALSAYKSQASKPDQATILVWFFISAAFFFLAIGCTSLSLPELLGR